MKTKCQCCGKEFDDPNCAWLCERLHEVEDNKLQFIRFKRMMKKFRKEEAKNNIPSYFNNTRRYG